MVRKKDKRRRCKRMMEEVRGRNELERWWKGDLREKGCERKNEGKKVGMMRWTSSVSGNG